MSLEYQDIDLTDPETLLEIATHVARWYSTSYLVKQPMYDSLRTGSVLTKELLTGNDTRFFNFSRMSKPAFAKLVDVLKGYGMRNFRGGCQVEEQILVFLNIVNNGHYVRTAQETFQHSGETISRCFYQTLDALCKYQRQRMYLPDGSEEPEEIYDNDLYFPYFQNVIGAIDGTHVPAYIKGEEVESFRNRKGMVTQNCLIACGFDM